MEALFRHWIKNVKYICDYLSHNSDFFFIIAWYKLAILRTYQSPPPLKLDFNSHLWVNISQFWEKCPNCEKKNSELWVYIT